MRPDFPPTVSRINVRTARAMFSTILKSNAATVIGDRYQYRALVIPINQKDRYNSADLAKALVVAQGLANQAFRELRKGFE